MIDSWKHLKFWKSPAIQEIGKVLVSKPFLPHDNDIYKALELTPFDKVKVVLLGQDPYHTKGYAHGLAFSVLPHNKGLPASLRNIFKEYQTDLGYPKPRNGDLRVWAERGVLLLNTILTVEEGKPLSHKGIGWEKLTYEVIRELATKSKVVFILLGSKAQDYKAACDPCPVVAAVHPSPFSASSGFFGSKIFTKANKELEKLGVEPVDWRLA